MSVELAVYRDIGDVPVAEWDAVPSADELQLGRPFLRTCQEAAIEDAELRFVVVRRGGEPAAIAVLTGMSVALDLLSGNGTRRVVEGMRRWRPSFLRVPVVLCGPPVSFGQPGLKLAPGADRAEVLGALHETMDAFARERSAGVTVFKEFDPEGARDLAPLRDLGYIRASSLPSWSLDLPWASWDEYRASLRAGYRRQIRTTLRAARRARLGVLTLSGLGGHAEDVRALYDRVMERARHRMEWLPPAFFAGLARNLPQETRLILLEHRDRPVACAVMLHGPALSTFLLAGVDWERAAETQAYPNLVLEVVREAIRAGARRVELGQTSDAMKSRVGAAPAARWVFLRHRGAIRHRLLARTARVLFPEPRVPARRVFAPERSGAAVGGAGG